MKTKSKVVLGIIIGVLVLYSGLLTFSLYMSAQDYNELNASKQIAAKATENKSECYEMMGIAYTVASSIESGRYDEEQIDEIVTFKAENRGYDETAFRKCVELILKSK